MNQEASTPHTSLRFWAGLATITAIGLVLRAIHLVDHSYTADEVYELRHLSTDLFTIARDPDGFPPIYRWLCSWLYGVAGDWSTRLVSVFFGTATIAVVGILGREIKDYRLGLWSAAWCAISAHQIDFSQQGRSYSIVLFGIACCMLAAWWVAQNSNHRSWWMLLAASWFALGTHYFAALCISQLWILLWFVSTGPKRLRWIGYAALYVCICWPWISSLRIDLTKPVPAEMVNPFDLTGYAYTYYSLIAGWTIGPSQIELLEWSRTDAIQAILPWAILLFGLSLFLSLRTIRALPQRARLGLFCLLSVTPLLAGLLAWLEFTSFVSRYVCYLSIPLALWFASGASEPGHRGAKIAWLALVGCNLFATWNRWNEPRYDRENYAAFQQWIDRDRTETTNTPTVLVLSHYLGHAVRQQLPTSWPVIAASLGSDEPDDWNEQLSLLKTTLREGESYVVVTDWLPAGHGLHEDIESFMSIIQARPVVRISNTLQVYMANQQDLRVPIESPTRKQSSR